MQSNTQIRTGFFPWSAKKGLTRIQEFAKEDGGVRTAFLAQAKGEKNIKQAVATGDDIPSLMFQELVHPAP